METTIAQAADSVDAHLWRFGPVSREATNAARIRAQTGEHLLTIPKPK